jgi:hypothetical protein
VSVDWSSFPPPDVHFTSCTVLPWKRSSIMRDILSGQGSLAMLPTGLASALDQEAFWNTLGLWESLLGISYKANGSEKDTTLPNG